MSKIIVSFSCSLQFCSPRCIAILLCHLALFPLQSSTSATSLGPWGTIPRGTKALATCCLLARFPMDTGDTTGDDMQFAMAILQQHRPYLGRFDPRHLSHPLCPLGRTPHAPSSTQFACYAVCYSMNANVPHSNIGEHSQTAVQQIRRPALRLVTPIVTSKILHFSLC